MAFLELSNLNKRFGSFVAVENFNLNIERGEFVSFLGPSGCGKTTTLRMVAGFEVPTEGKILINKADITNKAPNQRNVGMVFQSYALFPNLNVADNIGFGLKVAHQPADEIKQRVDEMLGIIHMEDFATRYPYQMSGGQQQRVALARALAIRPQVLLLDEPLSALDAKIRVELRNEIRSIQQKLGITTVYVTHDQEEALSLSDRVVVMKSGHMEQVGTPFEIYNFPKTPFVASFVGTLNVLNAVVKDALNGVFAIGGQEIVSDRPALEVNGATVKLALRPESVHVANETETGFNHLKVVVERITFLGSIVRIMVRWGGENTLFFDHFNNPHLVLPKVGEEIELSFPHEACLFLGRS